MAQPKGAAMKALIHLPETHHQNLWMANGKPSHFALGDKDKGMTTEGPGWKVGPESGLLVNDGFYLFLDCEEEPRDLFFYLNGVGCEFSDCAKVGGGSQAIIKVVPGDYWAFTVTDAENRLQVPPGNSGLVIAVKVSNTVKAYAKARFTFPSIHFAV